MCIRDSSWPVLKNICDQKINQKNHKKIREQKLKQQQQKDQEKKERQQKIINIKIDDDIINALHSRRKKRDEPVILVVEDDIFSQRLVKNIINKNYDVATAKNGHEAITTYVQEAPDILFLDIELPDINGHDVLSKIFEIDESAHVVMLSGNGDRKNIMKAIEKGAKGFIGKPFTRDKIFQYIESSPHIKKKQKKEYA